MKKVFITSLLLTAALDAITCPAGQFPIYECRMYFVNGQPIQICGWHCQ